MLPALIPFALSVAPEIGRWLFGSTGERVTQAATEAIRAVTGTDDPAEARAALDRDPGAATTLRVRLAEIAAQQEQAARQAELDELRARLADVASARGQTVDLARAGSSIGWGAPAVSVLVLLAFAGAMYLALTRALPTGSETILNVLLGNLATMASGVVGYWVGSSAGSAQKTDLLAGRR